MLVIKNGDSCVLNRFIGKQHFATGGCNGFIFLEHFYKRIQPFVLYLSVVVEKEQIFTGCLTGTLIACFGKSHVLFVGNYFD
ncbi:MAG: hypothetical protein PVI00_15300, partial [Desulfobacterales bacterium]